MTSSVREQALAAFFALVETVPGITAKRTPDFAFKVADLPAVAQFAGGHQVVDQASGIALRTTRIKLECGVTAASVDGLEEAASDLHAAIVKTIMADPTLGGLIAGMVREVEMTDPDFDDVESGGVPNSRFALIFEIDLATDEADPFVLASY